MYGEAPDTVSVSITTAALLPGESPAGDPAGPGEVQGPGGRGAQPAAEDGDGAAGNRIS